MEEGLCSRGGRTDKPISVLSLLALAAVTMLLPVIATRAAAQDTNLTSVLYNFTGGADGASPYSNLIHDAAGNLYGTTAIGGNVSRNCGLGCGAVFKLDTAGNETTLHSFTGGSDGGIPAAGLVRDTVGNLYGATANGGASNSGVVFKLDSMGGHSKVLHGFTGADGSNPYGTLVRDAAGNLYGTTGGGGANGGGVVFKVDPAGTETVLYSFTGGSDGNYPTAGLVQDRRRQSLRHD